MLFVTLFTINLKVKDVHTYYGIENIRVIVKTPSNTYMVINSESPIITIPANEDGKYELEFYAKGYKSLKTYFILKKEEVINVDVLLEPEISPIYGFEESSNYAIVVGYVHDERTLRPLSDVAIKVEDKILYTDQNGKFIIKLNTLNPYRDEFSRAYKVIMKRTNFIFSKTGYKVYKYNNLALFPGITILKIGMSEGNGDIVYNEVHGIVDRKPYEYLIKDGYTSSENGVYDRNRLMKMKENSINVTDVIPLPFFDPPSSIRVGTNCSCTNCSSVSVMSLESYVQTGLNDEWIASWNAHSLRAGALAYRAYGSWHVLNPISNNYDICSTTCCQVWDGDYSVNTVNAAKYTSGFAISPQANSVSRAEYSAENNGWDDPNDNLNCVNSCPCGDGKAGSPCTGWPCINDNLCSGHGCFGHGRGMCQWGTKRWGDNGKYWDWMAVHYYSSKNWHISTPMGFLNLSASPTNINPGQTFTISVDIYSGTPDTHPRIMLGASLYDGVNWISNPANDIRISVIPGTKNYTRQFTTPYNIQAKCYDLVVMIWFDVDENNAINSPNDLPIDRITKTNYICVTATKLTENNFGNFKFHVEGSKIIFTGHGNIAIYSIDGKLIVSEFVNGKKVYNVKKGIYILKHGNLTKSIVIK
ncbi:MAG: SpoIID/LytB domain-containing protein [candidate division WOR-3 bacterium]|nr:hypothetical protein [candidate division WOR-3 bacterium]MDW8150797.1 SpoIID/LytB domain-containing protein [candidate division WOR-3 bacterium]